MATIEMQEIGCQTDMDFIAVLAVISWKPMNILTTWTLDFHSVKMNSLWGLLLLIIFLISLFGFPEFYNEKHANIGGGDIYVKQQI